MGLLYVWRGRPHLHLVCIATMTFTYAAVESTHCRHILLWHAPHTTFAAGGVLRNGYLLAAGYLSFLLLLYPIAWACSEGGNVISVTSEMIWYGILDVLSGPVFLFFFLWELRGVDYASFGLHSGKYTDKSAFHPAGTVPVTSNGAAGNV